MTTEENRLKLLKRAPALARIMVMQNSEHCEAMNNSMVRACFAELLRYTNSLEARIDELEKRIEQLSGRPEAFD